MRANAALYLDPEAYLTSNPVLMGRHSAGESFLRGFLRHGEVDRFHFWNVTGRPQAELDALVQGLHVPAQPVTWIDMRNRRKLGTPGVVQLTGPFVGREAWQRRPFGAGAYALCGLTHTTSELHAGFSRDVGRLPDVHTHNRHAVRVRHSRCRLHAAGSPGTHPGCRSLPSVRFHRGCHCPGWHAVQARGEFR